MLRQVLLRIVTFIESHLVWPYLNRFGQSAFSKSFHSIIDLVFTFLSGRSLLERIAWKCSKLDSDGRLTVSPIGCCYIDSAVRLCGALDPTTPLLAEALNKVKRLQQFKIEIKAESRTKYDPVVHKTSLDNIWLNFTGEDKPPPIPSERWSEIGFQGSDPSTDFRGMGVFGLHQLEHFSKDPLAPSIWKQSNGEDWFSLAVIGINISGYLSGLLECGGLDATLYAVDDDEGDLRASLDTHYTTIFAMFSERWRTSSPCTLMHFPHIFAACRKDFENKLGQG